MKVLVRTINGQPYFHRIFSSYQASFGTLSISILWHKRKDGPFIDISTIYGQYKILDIPTTCKTNEDFYDLFPEYLL
jgi:hypothetical protein